MLVWRIFLSLYICKNFLKNFIYKKRMSYRCVWPYVALLVQYDVLGNIFALK